MKLATRKDGTRDGRLLVVSADGAHAADAPIKTLQAALDDWAGARETLAEAARRLDADPGAGAPFDPAEAAAPLPRAYQWADASAYVNHVELVRRARGAAMPDSFWTDPLMYQGGSDAFLGPHDPIPLGDPTWGCDLEGEIAVILDDTPHGVDADAALSHVALVTMVNDVSLRGLIPGELAKGFGFFQSKPPTAFAPVAATPDSLGAAWSGGTLTATMRAAVNGEPIGAVATAEDMTFDFGRLIAHAARTRPLSAGTVIGSGTVSNKDGDGGPGRKIAEGGRGYACIAEIRTVETILTGAATTPFLTPGDRIEIDVVDAAGSSLFGAIRQTIVAA